MITKFVSVWRTAIFVATASADSDYPGIDVEYITDKESENALSRPRVLVEWSGNGNSPDDTLRALRWSNPDEEDYVEEIPLIPYGGLSL